VMPEDYMKALKLFPQFAQHLNFLERTLGPYPFRAEKHGIAQTFYSGMEHQTVISYGATFENNRYGFDQLHFHELTHQWFANLVSVPDWQDWWLHEGTTSYLEAIYAESLLNTDAYHSYLADFRHRIRNQMALAPYEPQRTRDIYGGDLYYKGAWVLHSLRYLLGKDAVLKTLRLLAYPDPAMEYVSDGRQCHFATTQDFQEIVEQVSGKNLDWFFEVYCRQPTLPQLEAAINGNIVKLRWIVPGDLPFPMPVEVHHAGEIHKLEMAGEEETLVLPKGGGQPAIDPDNWILRAELN